MRTRERGRRAWRGIVAGLALFGLLPVAVRQAAPAYAATLSFPVVESFAGSTLNNRWLFNGVAALTNESDGWLRLTPSDYNQRGAAVLLDTVSTTNGVQVDFDYATYGTINNFPADGIALFLTDGAVSESQVNIGAWGGCLGYSGFPGSPDTGCASGMGVRSGYVGIALDEYGNFAAAGSGLPGTTLLPGITVVGSGNGPNITYRNPQRSGEYNRLAQVPVPSGIVTGSRAGARHVRFIIARGQLSVWMGPSASSMTQYITNFNIAGAAGQVALPSTVRLGITASTGGGTNVHEVRNLTINRPVTLSELSKTTALPGGATTLIPGSSVTYTVRATVDPNSPNPLIAGQLQDTVPAALTGVTWTCTSPNGATCATTSGSGNTISTRVDASYGQTIVLTITGTVGSTLALNGTVVSNTATITPASGYSLNLTSAVSTPNFTVLTQSQLTGATSAPASITPGATGVLSLNVANGSIVPDPSVGLTVSLPSDFAADTTALPAGCSLPVPSDPTQVSCSGLSVPASGTLTVALPIWAASGANPSLTAKAAASASITITGSRMTAPVTTTASLVVGPARFTLAVEPTTSTSVVPGGASEAVLTVRNLGPSDAWGTGTLTWTPPSGTVLSVAPATPLGVTCTTPAASTLVTFAPLAAGGTYPSEGPLSCSLASSALGTLISATSRNRTLAGTPLTLTVPVDVLGAAGSNTTLGAGRAQVTATNANLGTATAMVDDVRQWTGLVQRTPDWIATSSSTEPTLPAAVPSDAIDRDTDGNAANGKAFVSALEASPWWQLDLGRNEEIGALRLWARTDTSTDTSDLTVSVSNVAFSSPVSSTAGVSQFTVSGAVARATDVVVNRSGRYVRIQRTGTTRLGLAEVQVLRPATLVDLAAPTETASSTATGTPATAADGTFTNAFATSSQATPWWQVDLGTTRSLGTIRIWGRSDCCTAQTANLQVLTSSDGSTWGSPVVTYPATVDRVVELPLDVAARYVRIQRTDTGVLGLAEVQLTQRGSLAVDAQGNGVGAGVATLLPRTSWAASQSTTSGGAASLAVDGNANGTLSSGSVTSTGASSSGEWWQVDLGSVQNVGTIRIWNRTDCCRDRLRNLRVYASANAFGSDPAVQSPMFTSYVPGTLGDVTEVPVYRKARYVRLSLRPSDVAISGGYGTLSLAEVELTDGGSRSVTIT